MRSKLLATSVAVVLTSLILPALAEGAPTRLDSTIGSAQLRTAVRVNPPAPPPPPQSPASPAHALVGLVNAERAARGLAPMVSDPLLDLAAQRHSEDQAAMRKMSHTGSDGSTMVQRIDRVGFDWRSAAENVAVGYGSPEAVMAGWMNSSGHRRNILSSNTRIGVGLAYSSDGRPYWTQVFAAPR